MKKLCKAAAAFLLRADVLARRGSKEDTKTEEKILMVSVAQIVEHKSLNTIRDSFKVEMETLDYKNGENIRLNFKDADKQQNTLNSIISTFAGGKSDVIMTIATPTAMAIMKHSKDIPIVFFTVSDPVGAGLMDDLKEPNNNITGASDGIQVDQIFDLALKVGPNLKTPGFIHNNSEADSVGNLTEAKELRKKRDIKLVEGGGANITEVQSAVGMLAGKCSAISVPNDSAVASSMSVLVETANKKKIPVYTGTDSMINDGGFVTVDTDYAELGKETARMTDKILKGEDAENLPAKAFKDNLNIHVNEKTMETLGIRPLKDIENSKNLIMM